MSYLCYEEAEPKFIYIEEQTKLFLIGFFGSVCIKITIVMLLTTIIVIAMVIITNNSDHDNDNSEHVKVKKRTCKVK